MTDSNLITTTDLVKTFTMGSHEFTALNKINLSFKTGEFSGLVGPSGSGKTTFLNILGSLDVPTQGKAVVFGHSISELSTKKMAELRNHHLGFIFQTYNLLAVYTVYENVELPLLLLKMPEAERKNAVLQSLEWVGLTDKWINNDELVPNSNFLTFNQENLDGDTRYPLGGDKSLPMYQKLSEFKS